MPTTQMFDLRRQGPSTEESILGGLGQGAQQLAAMLMQQGEGQANRQFQGEQAQLDREQRYQMAMQQLQQQRQLADKEGVDSMYANWLVLASKDPTTAKGMAPAMAKYLGMDIGLFQVAAEDHGSDVGKIIHSIYQMRQEGIPINEMEERFAYQVSLLGNLTPEQQQKLVKAGQDTLNGFREQDQAKIDEARNADKAATEQEVGKLKRTIATAPVGSPEYLSAVQRHQAIAGSIVRETTTEKEAEKVHTQRQTYIQGDISKLTSEVLHLESDTSYKTATQYKGQAKALKPQIRMKQFMLGARTGNDVRKAFNRAVIGGFNPQTEYGIPGKKFGEDLEKMIQEYFNE